MGVSNKWRSKEDINDRKVEPSFHEDEEPLEDDNTTNEAWVIHEDLEIRDVVKKILERYNYEDLRYTNTSQAHVILPPYKEAFRGQTTRRVKKKRV